MSLYLRQDSLDMQMNLLTENVIKQAIEYCNKKTNEGHSSSSLNPWKNEIQVKTDETNVVKHLIKILNKKGFSRMTIEKVTKLYYKLFSLTISRADIIKGYNEWLDPDMGPVHFRFLKKDLLVLDDPAETDPQKKDKTRDFFTIADDELSRGVAQSIDATVTQFKEESLKKGTAIALDAGHTDLEATVRATVKEVFAVAASKDPGTLTRSDLVAAATIAAGPSVVMKAASRLNPAQLTQAIITANNAAAAAAADPATAAAAAAATTAKEIAIQAVSEPMKGSEEEKLIKIATSLSSGVVFCNTTPEAVNAAAAAIEALVEELSIQLGWTGGEKITFKGHGKYSPLQEDIYKRTYDLKFFDQVNTPNLPIAQPGRVVEDAKPLDSKELGWFQKCLGPKGFKTVVKRSQIISFSGNFVTIPKTSSLATQGGMLKVVEQIIEDGNEQLPHPIPRIKKKMCARCWLCGEPIYFFRAERSEVAKKCVEDAKNKTIQRIEQVLGSIYETNPPTTPPTPPPAESLRDRVIAMQEKLAENTKNSADEYDREKEKYKEGSGANVRYKLELIDFTLSRDFYINTNVEKFFEDLCFVRKNKKQIDAAPTAAKKEELESYEYRARKPAELVKVIPHWPGIPGAAFEQKKVAAGEAAANELSVSDMIHNKHKEYVFNKRCGEDEHVVAPGLGNLLGTLAVNSEETTALLNNGANRITPFGLRPSHGFCNAIKSDIPLVAPPRKFELGSPRARTALGIPLGPRGDEEAKKAWQDKVFADPLLHISEGSMKEYLKDLGDAIAERDARGQENSKFRGRSLETIFYTGPLNWPSAPLYKELNNQEREKFIEGVEEHTTTFLKALCHEYNQVAAPNASASSAHGATSDTNWAYTAFMIRFIWRSCVELVCSHPDYLAKWVQAGGAVGFEGRKKGSAAADGAVLTVDQIDSILNITSVDELPEERKSGAQGHKPKYVKVLKGEEAYKVLSKELREREKERREWKTQLLKLEEEEPETEEEARMKLEQAEALEAARLDRFIENGGQHEEEAMEVEVAPEGEVEEVEMYHEGALEGLGTIIKYLPDDDERYEDVEEEILDVCIRNTLNLNGPMYEEDVGLLIMQKTRERLLGGRLNTALPKGSTMIDLDNFLITQNPLSLWADKDVGLAQYVMGKKQREIERETVREKKTGLRSKRLSLQPMNSSGGKNKTIKRNKKCKKTRNKKCKKTTNKKYKKTTNKKCKKTTNKKF